MKSELNILVLENDVYDAELIDHELRKGDLAFRFTRVESREAFLNALRHDRPDVILSDHGLPSFNGFAALAVAREECPQVPFIFVSGLKADEDTVETFRSSATDYVLKSDLSRLVPVMRRAVRKAEARAERRRREQVLKESEEGFRLLVEGVKDFAICMLDPEGRVNSWNTGAEWITGYPAPEILGRHFSCFYPNEAIATGRPARALQSAAAEGRFQEEGLLARKAGATFWANVILSALRDHRGALRGFALVTRDITERKQAEIERERLIQELYTALTEVKTLTGLLPLCASCKKVRDYRGQWHPLEAYLRERSDATLTHEFCPDCAKHLRPSRSDAGG